jgi:hypothetical protein
MLDVVIVHVKPTNQTPSLGETVKFAPEGKILRLLEIVSWDKNKTSPYVHVFSIEDLTVPCEMRGTFNGGMIRSAIYISCVFRGITPILGRGSCSYEHTTCMII